VSERTIELNCMQDGRDVMDGTTQCKCGVTIVWAVTESGARVPLDVRPHVYEVERTGVGPVARKMDSFKPGERNGYAISHFATCPFASEFSKKARTANAATSHNDDTPTTPAA
jgi:hypothetical protein